jgi:hypothetical protein
MIQAKPFLESMLLSCASPPFKLRLHGSHWDSSADERIRTAWKGLLPKNEIASAYNSAEVVIASTILDQAKFGMINNRIFEALACGSLVISDYFEALDEMFGDLIFFAQNSDAFKSHLKNILSSETNFSHLRLRAREVIMSSHTWNHRIISLFDFYSHLQSPNPEPFVRDKSPLVALIVDEKIRNHGDFVYSIQPALVKYLQSGYVVHQFDVIDWELFHQNNSLASRIFNVIIAVMCPYDSIHQSFFKYFHPDVQRVVLDRKAIQKLLCYVIGSPPSLETVTTLSPSWYRSLTDIFDVVLYRDSYEKNLLVEVEDYRCASEHFDNCASSWRDTSHEKRWQHAFGVAIEAPHLHPLPVVLCLNNSMSYCTRKIRDSTVTHRNYRLLLIGGKLDDWLRYCLSESDIDCVLKCVSDPPLLIEMLSRTLHFSSYQSEILTIICSAQKVYLLFDVQTQADSVNDQLWPVITAAVCNRPIHFLHHPGAHVRTILSDGCNRWNEEYLQTSWKHASQRLHGLASSRSKVSISSNYAPGQYFTHDHLSQFPLIFQPQTDHFLAGRDGKICLYLDGSSQICLIRNFLEIVVQLSPPAPLPCKLTLNLSLVLRSHVFADEIYHSEPFLVHICPSQSPDLECSEIVPTPPHPLLPMEQVIFKLDLGNQTSVCSCPTESR